MTMTSATSRGLTSKPQSHPRARRVTTIWPDAVPIPQPMRDDGYDIADDFRMSIRNGMEPLTIFAPMLHEAHRLGLKVVMWN